MKGTIVKAERLTNTPSGNPVWRLYLEDGTRLRTAADHAVASSEIPTDVPVRIVTREDGCVTHIITD